MVTKIVELSKPKLNNPLFVEGLPGVGNVGRIAAGYLSEEIKAKKFAELISDHFMPFVLMHPSSSVHVLKNEFYYYKGKGKERDLIILVGDSQSVDPEGHYEVVEEILKYVKKFGVKDMVTLAGFGVGETTTTPKVIGATSDPELTKKYEKFGIDFKSSDRIGTIVGASGLLLGLGKYYGIKGICLLGETVGFPLLPDHKSAEAVLKILTKILNIELDLSKLEKKVKEMQEFIKRIQEVQTSAMGSMPRPEKGKKEDLSYIG